MSNTKTIINSSIPNPINRVLLWVPVLGNKPDLAVFLLLVSGNSSILFDVPLFDVLVFVWLLSDVLSVPLGTVVLELESPLTDTSLLKVKPISVS